MEHVFTELIEPDGIADVALLKKDEILFMTGRGNGQVATGANGIVKTIGSEPMGKAGDRLGNHDVPLSW